MSAFSTQLGEVLYSKINTTDNWIPYPTPQIITSTRPFLFDFDYPYFDAGQKASFESTFLKRFWFNEIGEETFNLFKLRLDTRLNEIMPNYVERYKMFDWIKNNNINWFDDVNLTEIKDQQIKDEIRRILSRTGTDTTRITGDETKTNNLSTQTNSTRTDNLKSETDSTRTDNLTETTDMTRTDDFVRWNKFSDTPQGALTGVEQDKWLTTATQDTDDGTSRNNGTVLNTGTVDSDSTTTKTGTQSNNTTKVDTGTVTNEKDNTTLLTRNTTDTDNSDNTQDLDYTLRLTGKRGSKSYIELLREFKNLNANINREINNECADLFMLLWQ